MTENTYAFDHSYSKANHCSHTVNNLERAKGRPSFIMINATVYLLPPDEQSISTRRFPGCQRSISAGFVALYPFNRLRHHHLHLCHCCPDLLSVWETTLKTTALVSSLESSRNTPPWFLITQTAALYILTFIYTCNKYICSAETAPL